MSGAFPWMPSDNGTTGSGYWECLDCKHRWLTNEYDENVTECPKCKSKRIKPE